MTAVEASAALVIASLSGGRIDPANASITTKLEAATASITGNLSGTGNASFSGFLNIGANSPTIKMKKLTGSIAAGAGAKSIAHGLTYTKIISVYAQLADDVGAARFLPAYTAAVQAGYEYAVYFDATNIVLELSVANSANIDAGNPYRILIVYEE